MSKRPFILVAIAVALISLVFYRWPLIPAQAQMQGVDFSPDDYQPRRVVKPFPPIINPKHVSVEEASARLRPNELVLGVEIDGVARAYPINMLTGPSREIFNDQLGEHRIAATW